MFCFLITQFWARFAHLHYQTPRGIHLHGKTDDRTDSIFQEKNK